jgi:hypothetical protein
MKIAYLMLVHSNPLLQKRAVDMLSSGDCGIFIHVDAKSDIRQFSSIRGDNVIFLEPRIPVYWGEFSQVEATMRLLQHALCSSAAYDYFVLLQGADYPLRSGKYIQAFFEQNRGTEFLSLVKMPAPGFPLSKINKLEYPSEQLFLHLAVRALGKMGLAQRDYRKQLAGLDGYAGDACWALSRDACGYLMEFAKQNPHVPKFFQNTESSDEMFFHTILGNSRFHARTRKSLMYRDYPARLNHPAILDENHVRFFDMQERIWVEDEWGPGEMLFARKFSDETLHVVDRIDEMIKRKEMEASMPKSEIQTA